MALTCGELARKLLRKRYKNTGSKMDFRRVMAALLLLAACGGNPFVTDDGGDDDGGDGGAPSATVPEEIAVNLRSITYDPANGGSLRVNVDGLLASPREVAFVRDASLDVKGYRAFTYQETGLQRTFLALVRDNPRGNLQAAVVADGGQFNRHFGGGTFSRLDVFTRPTIGNGPEEGQFSYAGTYAGVFLPGTATHPSLPAGLQPYSTLRVQGDALINANFANDLVNGGVENRWVLDAAGDRIDMNDDGVLNREDQLAAITLPSTDIDADGRFAGTVEFTGEPGSNIGNFGGLFGGSGATDVAGAIVINPIAGEDGIWEYGLFNLPRCGTAGDSPLCDPR